MGYDLNLATFPDFPNDNLSQHWVIYPKNQDRMNLPFTNIRQVLSLHNKVSPEKIFLTVITERGREELSYTEFSARSHQTANFLQEDLGIQPGDVVAILDDQSADVAVLMMACWLIGAVATPLSIMPNPIVEGQLTRGGVKAALIREHYLAKWQSYIEASPSLETRQFWDTLLIIQLGGEPREPYQHFHTLVRSMPNTFFNEYPEPTLESRGVYFHPNPKTSPAVVPLLTPVTQGDLLDAAQQMVNSQAITGNQRIISYLGLSAAYYPQMLAIDEATKIFLTALLMGGSLTINTDLFGKVQAFWREVAASRLHIACLSPNDVIKIINYAREQQAAGKPIYGEGVYQQDIKQLRHIYCPDAKGQDDLIRQFTALFPFPVVI